MAGPQAGGGQVVVRLLFLAVAPLVALLSGADGTLMLFTVASSITAAGLDVFRQRRRCLPFPIYLLLVYALQASSILVMPDALAEQSFGSAASHHAEPALRQDDMGSAPYARTTQEVKTMSIVMAAHNEHKYMQRTLDSIYETTPSEVLIEIIVIDDASTPPLKDSLTQYEKVRWLRHEDRRGLIKSKTEGGNAAMGDMIMFLDAHIKPDKDWYKPILRHMNINYKRVVVPLIPILDGETWQPNFNAVGVKMMFDWTLFFQWFDDHSDLVPCMSGGLFGITKDWWHESGEYDYGMKMWGAENIEQSIRVWLCGGEIYVARDSRVSHVFRPTFPYKINNTEIYINKVRTVETWFDDYKERFYKADPAARQFVKHVGNISSRLALKTQLNCKPFEWYVNKFKKVFEDKHMLAEEVFLIRDKGTNMCLQSSADADGIVEAACNRDLRLQHWAFASNGNSIHNAGANKCLDANAAAVDKAGGNVFMYHCFPQNQQQTWSLRDNSLRWDNFCVQSVADGSKLKLGKCDNFLENIGQFEQYDKHTVLGPGSL